ncbi:MAG TPA: hypothetical protein VFK47_15495 [Ktedonobacteraceae bacterium]|nr:hypothetical protein [Ktedonobacteraceae bacterium]
MTKKFSWEVDKTSLILRVTDGAKETTWTLRKNTPGGVLLRIFEELQMAMWSTEPVHPTIPAALAEEALSQPPRRSESFDMDEPAGPVVAGSEEESKAILQAQADAAKVDGKWFEKSSYELPNIFALGHGQEVD